MLNNKEVNYSAMPKHPSNEIFGIKSKKLSGKNIVLGVTGSIAAVETVKLIHELLRHSATVYPVMTEAATQIIAPEALQYASGNKPITKLTGEVEHVALCGQVKDNADLLLIAPCTANTISKIACGIDDTTVTTFATTAIGSKIPIIIVPAMHGSMYEHPIILENVKRLQNKKLNIKFVHPVKSENKWKFPSIEKIVNMVIKELWQPDLKGKSVLIIAGATAEPIDDMRILTNRSTGYTGTSLAKLAYLRGAEVALWMGKSVINSDEYAINEQFETADDLKRLVSKIKMDGKDSFDIIIVCAAISDYKVNKQIPGKLASGMKLLKLELVPTTKIIKIIRKKCPKSFLVGFKAESNQIDKRIINKAYERLTEWKLNMIIANDLKKVTEKTNQIFIINLDKSYRKIKGDKELLAENIFDEILRQL